jgi:hypothetical protein
LILEDKTIDAQIQVLERLKDYLSTEDPILRKEYVREEDGTVTRCIEWLQMAKGKNYTLPDPVFPPERHFCLRPRLINDVAPKNRRSVSLLRLMLQDRERFSHAQRLALIIAHHVTVICIPSEKWRKWNGIEE